MRTNEILANLADYYGKEISEGVSRIYLNTMADIEPELLEEACNLWVVEGKQFMPKVVELREYAERARSKRVNPDPALLYWRAQAAYGAVLRGELPPETLEDRRYKKYLYQGAKSYDELSESDKAFWDMITSEAEPAEIVEYAPA